MRGVPIKETTKKPHINSPDKRNHPLENRSMAELLSLWSQKRDEHDPETYLDENGQYR